MGQKQIVLCNLQVANAYLRQIIFESHALQMPNVLSLYSKMATAPHPQTRDYVTATPLYVFSLQSQIKELKCLLSVSDTLLLLNDIRAA